jgi:hypothetical protein
MQTPRDWEGSYACKILCILSLLFSRRGFHIYKLPSKHTLEKFSKLFYFTLGFCRRDSSPTLRVERKICTQHMIHGTLSECQEKPFSL